MLPPLRGVCGWALLLTGAVVWRDALDWWLAPTQDFYARSIVSTALAAAIYVGAGAWGASRLQSVSAGVVTGIATGLIAAIALSLLSSGMLAVRHDPHTMTAIRASGGVAEVFLLPFVVIVPGAVFASIGAAAGWLTARLLDSRPAR